jgi:hypothetical protein
VAFLQVSCLRKVVLKRKSDHQVEVKETMELCQRSNRDFQLSLYFIENLGKGKKGGVHFQAFSSA